MMTTIDATVVSRRQRSRMFVSDSVQHLAVSCQILAHLFLPIVVTPLLGAGLQHAMAKVVLTLTAIVALIHITRAVVDVIGWWRKRRK